MNENNYLLDTHVLLNFFNSDDNPNSYWIKTITNKNNSIYLSRISFWEITIKKSLGKLQTKISLKEFEYYCNLNNIEIIDFDLNCLEILETLPFFHRDPFDRYLISLSIKNNLKFLTIDSQISKYTSTTKLQLG